MKYENLSLRSSSRTSSRLPWRHPQSSRCVQRRCPVMPVFACCWDAKGGRWWQWQTNCSHNLIGRSSTILTPGCNSILLGSLIYCYPTAIWWWNPPKQHLGCCHLGFQRILPFEGGNTILIPSAGQIKWCNIMQQIHLIWNNQHNNGLWTTLFKIWYNQGVLAISWVIINRKDRILINNTQRKTIKHR